MWVKNLNTLIAVFVNLWKCKCWKILAVAVIPDFSLTFTLMDVITIGEQQGALVSCQIKDLMQRIKIPFTFSSRLLFGETNLTPSPNVCEFALACPLGFCWCSSLQVPHPHSAPCCPRMCHEKTRVERMRFKQISAEQAASERNGLFLLSCQTLCFFKNSQ